MSGPNPIPTVEQLAGFVREVAMDENPLDQIARAVELQAHLAELSDSLLENFVNEARRASHSWSEIGDVLGVSKQAAHQRHRNRRAQYRLSEEAQLGFASAQREAQQLRHNYLGTEHLLLGLVAEPATIAGPVLASLGIDLKRTRSRVKELEGKGNHEVVLPPSDLTPNARNVLDTALRTALTFGYKYVYSPHIALAFFEARAGMAGDLLGESKVTLGQVETSLMPLLPGLRQEQEDEKKLADEAAEQELSGFLQEARQQPRIPKEQMAATITRARKGDKEARQALVKHFLEKTAMLALEYRPRRVARHTAVAAANGALLQLASDPPLGDFEIALEAKVRDRLGEL